MQHLNIFVKPKPRKEATLPKKAKTGWESPVGWWRVTTEGDEEGRTIKVVGDFYGHVAEIALSVECPGYKLTFEPIAGRKKPSKRPTYMVAPDRVVSITLYVGSGTWDLKTDALVQYMTAWLDCPEIVVTPSNYFAAVIIQLFSNVQNNIKNA